MTMAPSIATPSGFDFYRFNFQLGPREIVRAIDYFRYFEHRLVAERLALEPGMSVLDLGSGTGLFALYLAARLGCRVVASDVADHCLEWQRQAAKRVGMSLEPGSEFEVREIDSREIPFEANTFDRVINLGSIEHIPGHGDKLTASEMARVCKPGGRLVLSVPYAREYTEDETPSHYCGFERRYDEATLRERIIDASRLPVIAVDYFGEPTFPFSRAWYPLPFALKVPFRHFMPLFSNLFLRRLSGEERNRACGVCLTLGKSRSA